jgi:ADP-ribosylglycohydrolase
MDLKAIQSKFGSEGIRDFVPAYDRLGAITDDTQMTLFTAEGLMRAHVRGFVRGLCSLPCVVGNAYLRWLKTQGGQINIPNFKLDGWLIGHQALFSTRTPGNTCLAATKARKALGDGGAAQNDSKGCGGVMRAAPVGLYTASRRLPESQAFT